MPLFLNQGTLPNLLVTTYNGDSAYFNSNTVYLGEYKISMKDFVELTLYVLQATDLDGEKDPRLRLVETIKEMETVEGFKRCTKRLKSRLPEIEKNLKKYKQEFIEEIRKKFVQLKKNGYKYMLVVHGFARGYIGEKTKNDAEDDIIEYSDPRRELDVLEVYNLDMNIEEQLKEPKAWNI